MKIVTTACLILLVLQLLFVPPTSAADASYNLVEVTSGDTLFGIVRLHYPGSASRWSLIENEVHINNPQAFMNGDKGRLRVGAVLKLPIYATAKKEIPPPPEAEVLPVRRSLATVGTVTEISGTPLALDINEEERELTLGGDIYNGDAIHTVGESAAHLQMNDGARLYVRSRSRVVINDYSFFENAPQSSRSFITLLKGGFRAITGLIGRHNPASVRIKTAVATIGIRGTDFAVRLCAPGECSLPDAGEFAAGEYSGVLGGEITISNNAGMTPVARGEVMRTTSADSAPVPAPEAAALIFTEAELALLNPQKEKPLGFFNWLRLRLFGDKTN